MARPLGELVHLHREHVAGQWLTGAQAQPMSTRERTGKAAGSVFGTSMVLGGLYLTDPFRLLTADQLWSAYSHTPDIRAAVDGIVRRIATWRWTIEVEGMGPDEDAEAAREAAAAATRFLRAPNADGETWQEVMTKVVTDLLVFEAGVLEEAYDRMESVPVPTVENVKMRIPATGAKLEELVALQGASITPIYNEYGRILAYRQDLWEPIASTTYLPRERLVTFSLFPNTSRRVSPLIEAIVNETITILRSSEHAMLAMDADEIPPGLVVLSGIAGKAAEQAKTDLQRLHGKDHKIRVVTNPDPHAAGATWVEFRRTPKDLSMIEVVREVRRTIWRVFGVLPIEMGDTQDMPRAVGQVQLDVASSHLVEPILDLIEAKVNARILPLLVGEEFAGKVALRFDREAKLSATEQKDKAAALSTLVRDGMLTRNEARVDLDQPPIEGGDVATITTSLGLQRVASLGDPDDEPEPDGAPDDSAPGEVDGGDEAESPDDAAPGEAERAHDHEHCLYGHLGHVHTRAAELPSEWPSASVFKGYRTADLSALAQSVAEYTAAVSPLYDTAADEVLAVVAAEYDKVLTDAGAQRAAAGVSRALDKLVTTWQMATEPIYRGVAKSARDQAEKLTGQDVVSDWQARGDAYGAKAIGYLTASGGLVSDLRAKCLAIIGAATGTPTNRGKLAVQIVPGMDEGALLSTLFNVFSSFKHRIENWSGRLVEESNQILTAGMAEGAAKTGDPEQAWYVEWAAVGDWRMCPTCAAEGVKGFRPASDLRVQPGGDTECQARCRCVLVWWTKEEVDSGAAVSLSGAAPGNEPL